VGERGIYEPPITKGVMQHGLGLEVQGTRCTYDMDDRDMLGEGWYGRQSARRKEWVNWEIQLTSSDAIYGAQFSDTESKRRVGRMRY